VNYLEVILLIELNGEKSVSEKTNSIRTDKFLYQRTDDKNWEQVELPMFIEGEDKYLPIVPTEVREKVKK
jgi:hypothetical protein